MTQEKEKISSRKYLTTIRKRIEQVRKAISNLEEIFGFDLNQVTLELVDLSIIGMSDNLSSSQAERCMKKCDEIEFNAYSLSYDNLQKKVSDYATELEKPTFSIDTTDLREYLGSSKWKRTKADNAFSLSKIEEAINILKEALDELQNKYFEWKESERNRRKKSKKKNLIEIFTLVGIIVPAYLGLVNLLTRNPFDIQLLAFFALLVAIVIVITIAYARSPKEKIVFFEKEE